MSETQVRSHITAIPPRSGTAFQLEIGQELTVIDPQGGQVADLLTASRVDVREMLLRVERSITQSGST